MTRLVEGREVLATLGEWAVSAVGRRVRVVEISWVRGKEVGHVRSTSLPVGRIKVAHFLLPAIDVNVPEDRDEETSHQVVERVEVVEPVTCQSAKAPYSSGSVCSSIRARDSRQKEVILSVSAAKGQPFTRLTGYKAKAHHRPEQVRK